MKRTSTVPLTLVSMEESAPLYLGGSRATVPPAGPGHSVRMTSTNVSLPRVTTTGTVPIFPETTTVLVWLISLVRTAVPLPDRVIKIPVKMEQLVTTLGRER